MKGVVLFYKSLQLTILKSWCDNRGCVSGVLKNALHNFLLLPWVLTSVRLYRWFYLLFFIVAIFIVLRTSLSVILLILSASSKYLFLQLLLICNNWIHRDLCGKLETRSQWYIFVTNNMLIKWHERFNK